MEEQRLEDMEWEQEGLTFRESPIFGENMV